VQHFTCVCDEREKLALVPICSQYLNKRRLNAPENNR